MCVCWPSIISGWECAIVCEFISRYDGVHVHIQAGIPSRVVVIARGKEDPMVPFLKPAGYTIGNPRLL